MSQRLQNQMDNQNGLPTGWELKRLDEIGEVYSGSTPSTSIPELWDGSVTWITPNDLSKLSTPYISDSARTISRKGLKSSSTHLLPARSIVISSRAPIGYIAIPLIEFCTNQGCKSIELMDEYNSEFVYYNLNFHVDKLKNLGNGTTFTEITKTALCTIELPFPKRKEEQTSIASVLSCIDRAIEKTEALIAKQQRIKTGLMQDLLTKGIDEHGNIRSETGHEFKDSPLGRIPKEWEARKLDDIVSPTRPIVYGILMPGYGYPGGIPVIKVKDIKNGVIATNDLLLTSPVIDNQYKRSKTKAGDLLFTIRGTVGRTAFVPDALDGANITQDTARIGICEGDSRFIRAYLSMPVPARFIDIHTLGVAVQGINLGDVRQIPIAFPPPTEQKDIGDIIERQEMLITKEISYYTKLKKKKVGLMQDLLTGQVSVESLVAEQTAVSA